MIVEYVRVSMGVGELAGIVAVAFAAGLFLAAWWRR